MQVNISELLTELGIEPVIHAAGPKTAHGGAALHPEVLAAMHAASSVFVDVGELNRAIGRFIAEVTGAEAGMVTACGASAVVLATAACMTRGDPASMGRLPDTADLANEIVLQRAQHGHYAYIFRHAGARLVEVGNVVGTRPEELTAAIGPRTAAVAVVLGPRLPRSSLPLTEVVALAHDKGVPVIVDAAASLPPKENLRRFIEEGADLVVISGGKMIHGPQDTGLLFGRADLVAAAMANAAPNDAIGRAHKMAREDMIGLYVALKRYLASDEKKVLAEYAARAETLVAAWRGLPGLCVEVRRDALMYELPVVVIRPEAGWAGLAMDEVYRTLLDERPRVSVLYDQGVGGLIVSPMNLDETSLAIVAERVGEVLGRRSR